MCVILSLIIINFFLFFVRDYMVCLFNFVKRIVALAYFKKPDVQGLSPNQNVFFSTTYMHNIIITKRELY